VEAEDALLRKIEIKIMRCDDGIIRDRAFQLLVVLNAAMTE
jgi:hypothetical protein